MTSRTPQECWQRRPLRLRVRQRGGVTARLLKWLAAALLAWLLFTCLAVLLLRWFNPLTSAVMAEARVSAWAEQQPDYRTDFRWASLEQISPHAAIAVIASEDQLFPFHAGFDFKSIREAVRAHEEGRKLRGASTITQQVAKNLFLWPGRSFVRKGIEAYITVLLEFFWDKHRIIETYLNVIEWGNGIYGAETASRASFGKAAASLSPQEAALMAAVLPAPRQWSPARPTPYIAERAAAIRERMGDVAIPTTTTCR